MQHPRVRSDCQPADTTDDDDQDDSVGVDASVLRTQCTVHRLDDAGNLADLGKALADPMPFEPSDVQIYASASVGNQHDLDIVQSQKK